MSESCQAGPSCADQSLLHAAQALLKQGQKKAEQQQQQTAQDQQQQAEQGQQQSNGQQAQQALTQLLLQKAQHQEQQPPLTTQQQNETLPASAVQQPQQQQQASEGMQSLPQEAQVSRLQQLAPSIGIAHSQPECNSHQQAGAAGASAGARGTAALQQEALVTQLLQKDQLAEAVAAVQQDVASVNRQQSLIQEYVQRQQQR